MSTPPPADERDEAAMRVGGIAAGLLAGLAVGVALGSLLVASGSDLVAGWTFFICVTVGAAVGYLSAAAGIGLAEGVIHFAVGLLHGIAERIRSPSEVAPWWLRWLFIGGVLVGLLLLVTRRW